MVRVEGTPREIKGFSNGLQTVVVDIQVSTSSDLPTINEQINGYPYVIAAGSTAQIIQTGVFCTLDGNGTWYDANGNAI